MTKINQQRRKWLSLGGVALGVSLLPNSVLAMLSTPKPRILNFRNINTNEQFSAEFTPVKGFSNNNLKKLDYLLRDKRNNQIHKMDPKLFVKFYKIQSNLGLNRTEIQIICGYRSPVSNASMRKKSRGVASNSYHMRGQAIDFRIDGVPLAKVKNAAERLNSGGVGYYPRSNFVHIDTGTVRTWSGSGS